MVFLGMYSTIPKCFLHFRSTVEVIFLHDVEYHLRFPLMSGTVSNSHPFTFIFIWETKQNDRRLSLENDNHVVVFFRNMWRDTLS
jgi:hypothetical protein